MLVELLVVVMLVVVINDQPASNEDDLLEYDVKCHNTISLNIWFLFEKI